METIGRVQELEMSGSRSFGSYWGLSCYCPGTPPEWRVLLGLGCSFLFGVWGLGC